MQSSKVLEPCIAKGVGFRRGMFASRKKWDAPEALVCLNDLRTDDPALPGLQELRNGPRVDRGKLTILPARDHPKEHLAKGSLLDAQWGSLLNAY